MIQHKNRCALGAALVASLITLNSSQAEMPLPRNPQGRAPMVVLPDGAVGVDVPAYGVGTGAPGPARMVPSGQPYVDADAYYANPAPSGVRYGGPSAPYGGAGTAAAIGPLWNWTILPDGLIYPSYLAGLHEPRLGAQYVYENTQGWLVDATFGGRVGILRYGNFSGDKPEGWQLDLEGAAFPRLNTEDGTGLQAADFRFGVPITYGQGPWRVKTGYYHLSSHIGDELIIADPDVLDDRRNFSRDAAVLGLMYYITPGLRVYGEAGYAFAIDGGTEPWEFQAGADFSPVADGPIGAPFAAVNGHFREELDYSGNFTAQLGWQWRGATGHLFRLGAHYYNGFSNQFSFFRRFEQQIGAGLWYDF